MGDRRHDPKARPRVPVHARTGGTLLVALLLFAAALVLLGRLDLCGRGLPRWLFVAGTWTLVMMFSGRVAADFQ